MDTTARKRTFANFLFGLLTVAWIFGSCSLVEEPLRKLDNNYARYQREVFQYNQKIADLNRITVYKTSTGSRYHRGYHYRTRNYPIPLGEAIKSGYTPCAVCNPPSSAIHLRRPPKYEQPFWIGLSEFVIWITGLGVIGGFYYLINRKAYAQASNVEQEIYDIKTRLDNFQDKKYKCFIQIGAFHAEAGVRDYTTWSKRMVHDFGIGVEPYLERIWIDLLKIFSTFRTSKHIAAEMKGYDFIMRQKLKGWIRLAVVTTPIACMLPLILGHPTEFVWYHDRIYDYYIEGWFAYPMLYGTANFMFWVLVGVFIKFAVPWVIDGFKNESAKLRQ
jgi:hypothetical protein